ncbi:PH domain-containing protein [Cytobacillus oceanisediminis]|uniref:PH domain-containing protein n=1 Tax=Cytobacillus oceanisediminis TaxID=665099 RepID=UPI001FB33972|nr:PH domain-containing protein [Cytobacillus oceanisediminis]UOE58121.1 PH domain-containing protein [Cytobacillus oceanisediminis]
MGKTNEEIIKLCREVYLAHIPDINTYIHDFDTANHQIFKLVSMHDDEQLLLCTQYLESFAKICYFLVTDRRCMLVQPSLTGGEVSSFPFDTIGSVEYKKSFTKSLVKIHLKTEKTHEFTHLKCDKVSGVLQQAMNDYKHPKAPASTPKADEDLLTQIQKLQELKISGALTEEEFSLIKRKLIEEF